MVAMEKQKENQVIQSVLNGNRDAYAILVDAYKDRIFNLAYRMTGIYVDAHDLAQETFIRAFAQLHRFDQEKQFFTWLYTMSLNIIRNHLRKSKRIRYYERDHPHESDVSDAASDPEGDIMTKEMSETIETCMQRLPTVMKEAVILRYFQDISFDDMADIMGVSSSAAKMRVYRGLKRLEDCVKEGTDL